MSRSEPNIIKYLLNITSLYKSRGFTPNTALMHRKFECLCLELLGHVVNLNTTAVSEHVPDIERQIRMIKERAWVIRSTLPFKIIPGRMIIEILDNIVLWINDFPPSSRVLKSFSLRTIMTGTALDFNKPCQIPLRAYIKVHEDRNITNTTDERTQLFSLGLLQIFKGVKNSFLSGRASESLGSSLKIFLCLVR
jgi:hypothetical protein